MKKILTAFSFFFSIYFISVYAFADTFSICAVDLTTNQVGGAAASTRRGADGAGRRQ